jgi:hypothetical protein
MSDRVLPFRRLPPPASGWVAAFCALSVWLLGVFAVSSELHGDLHTEAGHAEHTCAITLFSETLEDPTGAADIAVAPAFFPAGATGTPWAAPLTETADRLPPGRGPPLC